MGAGHRGPAGVLCDMCGAEMEIDRTSTSAWLPTDPPNVPVRCESCGYLGHKVALSVAGASALIAEAAEGPAEPEPPT